MKKAVTIFLFTLFFATNTFGQTVATKNPSARALHRTIVLPPYNRVDSLNVLWFDSSIRAGDTLKLNSVKYTIGDFEFVYSLKGEIFRLLGRKGVITDSMQSKMMFLRGEPKSVSSIGITTLRDVDWKETNTSMGYWVHYR